MTTSTTSIDIMGLQAAYANLHTDQERDYFMQRYHDVISSFGGKTSYDADNRPLLVMRSEERFSRNAETDLVCRLLLEKKKAEGEGASVDGERIVRKLAGEEELKVGRADKRDCGYMWI